MLIDPIYYAVFYDIAFPYDVQHAMNKRISKMKYLNLLDNAVLTKTVFLNNRKYAIVGKKTFQIINTVDNHLFIICEVKKL